MSGDMLYVAEPHQFEAMTAVAERLCGGTDRERDYGNVLTVHLRNMIHVPASELGGGWELNTTTMMGNLHETARRITETMPWIIPGIIKVEFLNGYTIVVWRQRKEPGKT